MTDSVVYHISIFGRYWPEHGKAFFFTKKKLKKEFNDRISRAYEHWKDYEKSIIDLFLEDGVSITRIDKIICPEYERFFYEKPFYKNDSVGCTNVDDL